MRRFLFLAAGLAACNGEIPAAPAPSPLAPRPIPVERGCDQLAASTPGSSWVDLGALSLPSGELVVTDPSVLGGPFEEPLRLPLSGSLSIRVLRVGEGAKEQPLCIQLRSSTPEGASRRLLGHVPVDTGLLVVGDRALLMARMAPARALVVPCAEAPEEELSRLRTALGGAGEQLEPVLPTLVCANRAAVPEDQPRISGALRQIHSEGRFVLEPRSPAWPLLRALGGRPWALFPGEQDRGAVIAESPGPDGAYPVVALGEGDAIRAIEIPLR